MKSSISSKRQIVRIVPPDPVCSSTLDSIRQNPKFARLLWFSINNLYELLRRLNPKHRVNAYYIIQEKGHVNLIQALVYHRKNEAVVCSVIQCLLRLINTNKQFADEYCYKIIEAGAPEALHDLICTTSIYAESMKLAMPLIAQLAASRSNVQRLIEAGLMQDCVDIIKDPKISQETSREAVETLLKFIHYPQARKELIHPVFVKNIMELLEQKIKDRYSILAGLKILASIVITNEGYELLKRDNVGLRLIVKILENHPQDKVINEISATILEKLATIEDIERALAAVKSGNTTQIPVLSSLLLVNELLRYVVQKGGILELILIMEYQLGQSQQESLQLVRSCTTALGRIAINDPRYIHEIYKHNGLEVITKACQKDSPDLLLACCDTVLKFAVDEPNTEIIISKGVIKALLERFETIKKTEAFVDGIIETLADFSKHPAGRAEIERQNGPRKFLKVMKEYKDNKEIQDSGLKSLTKLITDSSTAVTLIEEDIINHINAVTKVHSNWKKVHYYAVKVIDLLIQLGSTSPKFEKPKVFEAIINIVTTGITEDDSYQPVKTADQPTVNTERDDIIKAEETLTEYQEFELRNHAVTILQSITVLEDMKLLTDILEETSQAFSSNGALSSSKTLQQLRLFATVTLIPKIAEYLLTSNIPEKIAWNAKLATYHQPFEGRSDIVRTCIMFFEHLTHHHIHHENIRQLLAQDTVKHAALATITNALHRDPEERTVLQAIKGLFSLITNRVIEPSDRFTFESETRIGFKEASSERVIGAVISAIKKFEEEKVQFAGLTLLIAAINTDRGYIPLILSQGGTRLAISHLENINTSMEAGRLNMELISAMAKDPEALQLLQNQHAAHAIMFFLETNHNPDDIAKSASPILQLLAFELTESDLIEIIEILKLGATENDRLALVDTFEHLANLTLLNKNNELLIKDKAPHALLTLLEKELTANVEELIEAGVLELHKRILIALLSSLSRMRTTQPHLDKDLVQHGLFSSLDKIIKTRSDLTQPIAHCLHLLAQLIRNQQVNNEIVKNCAEADFVPSLVSFLESYHGNAAIMRGSIELLLAISLKYPDLVTRMGEKSFVRALVRETGIAVKLSKDDQNAMSVASQNFKCLVAMADNPTTLRQMVDFGAEDLAVSVVEKYIKKSKHGQAKRERAASIRPGQALLEIASAIGTHHSVVDVLIASSLELLEKILEIPVGQRAVVNASLGRELVNVLEDNTDVKMILSALRIIEKASRHEQLVGDLSDTPSLMIIMKAATLVPSNAELEQIIGRILINLGSNSMIPIIAEQVIEYSDRLMMNDPDTIEPYFNALNYYANLLSGPKDSKIEGNTGLRVYEVVQATLQDSKDNGPLLFAHVRVIERLVSREPEIRYHLRRSPIAEILAQLLSGVKAEVAAKVATHMVTKAAKEITSHEERNEIILDGTTGLRKLRAEHHDGYLKGLLSNNMLPIRSLLEVLEHCAKRSNEDQINQDSLASILTILNEVARESAQARAEIIKHNGLATVTQVYLHRIASLVHREEAREALRLLSILTETKNSYSTIATEALIERLIKDISEPEFAVLLADEDIPVVTEAGLSLLQRLTDIEHDHTLLKEKGCVETVIAIIENFKATCKPSLANKKITPSLLRACKAASQAMRALKSMLHDPVLARAAVKLQVKESTIGVLNLLAGAAVGSKEIETERLRQLQDIVSSQNQFNRFVEDTLGVLEVLAAHLRHEKMIDILGEDSSMYQDLMNIMSKIPDEVLASYRALGIFRHTLQHLGKQRILNNKDILLPVAEMATLISNLYPNIPLVVSLAEEVKSLAINGLTLKQIENLRADLDSIERAKKDFTVLANLIEDLVPREVDKTITEDERVKLNQVLKILKEVANDGERAGRIEQHDLFFLLAEILFHSHVDLVWKEAVIEIFNKLSRYPDQCLKLSNHTHVIHGHAAYILEVGVQVLNSDVADNSYQITQLIAGIETLERLIEVAKLLFQLPREVNLNAVTAAVCQIAEPACRREDSTIISSVVRILAILAVLHETAASTIDASGVIGKVMKRAENSIQHLKFARNFTFFVASTATSAERRTEYANYGVFERLRTANKKHPDDLDLNLATCMAYTSMVTGHHENGRLFLSSESEQYLEYLISKYSSEPTLVEAISRLLSTLASHNPENVHKLGELGAIKWIGVFFGNFNERTPDATVIECLKTVNNLNTSKENASRLIDQGFITTLIRYVTKHHHSSLVCVLVMSVIGHIAAHSDLAKVYKAIEEGAIEAIVKIANYHKTDKTILLAALDNLRLFMKDARCSQQLTQRGAIDMVLRILTTQDYDTDLVLKALHLFDDIVVSEDAINLTLDSEIVGILNGLLTTQRTAPEVLDTVLRLFAKLAIDQDRSLKVYQTGFLQAALKCVEGHAIRPSTAFELFKTLHKLSYNEDVALFIGEGSTATILKQIELNANNKIIVEAGTRLLVNLLENESAAHIAVNHRGVDILNILIRTHANDEVVSLQAYHALTLIALNSDRVRAEILRANLRPNVESLHKSFSNANKAEPTRQALAALENLERAILIAQEREGRPIEEEESPELKISHQREKQVEPQKIEFMEELNKSYQVEEQKTNQPIVQPVVQQVVQPTIMKQSTSNFNSIEKRNERLNLLKNDPSMKEAYQYLFRGKILKMWTPHGTNWPMHLLLSDDGYSLTLKGKKKWETTVRLDDIEGVWKGYFSNSPFTKPKKLFTKSPDQDYCFFFVTRPAADGTVKTLYFECQALDEREKFVDYLIQILKRLIQLQKEMRDR